ncbi:MAG: c-type cytochrome [Saprospiraceae bacterium]
MKQLLIFLSIALFVLGATAFSPDTGAPTDASNPKPDGEKIYKTYCVTCHGLYGDMGASGAANLTKSKLPLDERIKVITNGRNTMTGFKALLTPDKIKAVAKYTLELK